MSAKAQRLGAIRSTRTVRRVVQGAFFVFIVFTALNHHLSDAETTPSLHAYCPFGGMATLFRLVTEGQYVQKLHPSNVVLFVAIAIGTLVAGGAFCGWVCPFGTLNDIMSWIRRKLGLPTVRVPAQIDRWLRYGRYVTLILILYMTANTVKLWFGDWDPYYAVFSLDWLFELNLAGSWVAYAVAIVALAAALFIPRAWCRYACPLGGAVSLLNRFSLTRIRRDAGDCKRCGLCSRECPVGIDVENAAPDVGGDCIGCLECVTACPRKASLSVQLILPVLPGAGKSAKEA
ncbi:MAG: 4Fe-4S binding protein [Anaerolineae bacterium]|nr:4Fe-4S binding protein [Anaerolineae bacterium]